MTVGTRWLDAKERTTWLKLVAVLELLPAELDSQLRRDSGITHFDYYVLAMLSEAPGRTLRMTELSRLTNATLSRLSHVVKRLEERGLVERVPCAEDRRATNARLSAHGWSLIRAAAPGHVATVRHNVLDVLTRTQLGQLDEIATAVLLQLDPDRRLAGLYDPTERQA